MKRYIRSDNWRYDSGAYPHNSPQYIERLQSYMNDIPTDRNERARELLKGFVYQIFDDGCINLWFLTGNGRLDKNPGGVFEHSQQYLQAGGNIDLVTFTDDDGNVYTPYKDRKSINVTFTDGTSVDMTRSKAATLFAQTNKMGIYNPDYFKTPNLT